MVTYYKNRNEEFFTDDPEIAKWALKKGHLSLPTHNTPSMIDRIRAWPWIAWFLRFFFGNPPDPP